MKKRVLSVFRYALLFCLFIPSIVCASEDKYVVENFDVSGYFYGPKIKLGDYSKFYFPEYSSEHGETFKEYNWNSEGTDYNDNSDELEYFYPPSTEYGNYYEGPIFPLYRTLILGESEVTPSRYHFYTQILDQKEMVSPDIYLSSSKGESIGSFSDDNASSYNNSKVYELAKEDGYDYVAEAGDIILSTTDNGYKIIGRNDSKVTLFNGTIAYIVEYEFNNSVNYKEISATAIKKLLNKDNLTGLKLNFEFTIDEADYYSIILGNHTYFINEDFDDIIYETEVTECDVVDYYAIEFDEKIYVFLDFNKYYLTEEDFPEASYRHDYTIHTEVFDLEGNPLFGDINWLNLYYANYGSMFGITKDGNGYTMKFLTVDGEVLYSKDYTELFDEFNPYTVYGSIYLANHDTNSIESGKYLLNYYYEDYLDEDIYTSEYKFLTVNDHYVIEGKDQTFDGKDLVIKFNGDFDKFKKLLINDKVVSTDNYTKKSGSVIVTLKNDYLKSLKKGTYTVKAVFDDGEADTSIIIPEIDEQEEISNVTNPKTSDEIMVSIIIVSASLIGLLGTSIYLKKKILINKH